ncbi:NAD(P)/FAD-dependent oxidoreductase [Paeniglutamicibacter kerguelensis]|uniref:3-phenylpropionate/trans-cinnamate dioxygenase ferredoxin reductase subunit n=1 Tax=Paeniglutamicibacter kerguelensis TaxID=254788 RepID=A0ABS4XHQ9_9MICC|nr:FAD-dependent oxidoreductase [Paeniglutamicibacter kerguelensis]MBP2388011.1 3-phenylpropionate/trans-cinnamate dioxygenase ferredoxin reductase subunit [Paeniglutamicibacter kerguelensis]
MSIGGTLIVGAGQAGVELATALRAAGDDRPITMIGAERHAPYQRPPLSKGFLKDPSDAGKLLLRDSTWFAQQDITVACGESVDGLVWESDSAGKALTSTGRKIGFASLALATGATPRRLSLPGADLGGIHYLRSVEDARTLAQGLGQSAKLVVIGGGFIGLEVAETARQSGCRVTILEAAHRLIGRAVCETTSTFYLQAVQRRGTKVRTGAEIAGFTGENGSVRSVQVRDATGNLEEIAADLVLIGIGVVPETGLAERLGLAVDNGVHVDERMVASDGRTVALGDMANMPLPGGPRGDIERIRLESVPNAIEQARIAAATLMGGTESYSAVPWFWSDQGGIKLQIAGLSHGHDRTVLRGDPDSEKFCVLYYLREQLVAADCINNPRDFMAVKTALRTGVPLPPDVVWDVGVPLMEIVRGGQVAVSI